MVRYSVPISDSTVDRLLAIDGVVGVGEGIENGQQAIIVSVEDEQTADSADIPAELEGLPVFIEVTGGAGLASAGLPIAGSNAPPSSLPRPVSLEFTRPARPVPAGVSIGHYRVSAGTSSFLATDGSEVFQMSNSHVLAMYGDAMKGDPILQPGKHDGGGLEDKVGSLAGDVEVNDSGNKVDLAWHKPTETVSTDIETVGTPIAEGEDPEPGDEVTFIGRTSGLDTATVDRKNYTIEVGEERRQFVDQFRIDTPFLPGDSGAPVIKEDDDGNIIPVGIGFAATENFGIAMPISSVVEESGLKIIDPASFVEDNGDGETPDEPTPAEPPGGPMPGGVNKKAALLIAGAAGAAYLASKD